MKLKSNGSKIKINFKTNKNYRLNRYISREIISTNFNKIKSFIYLKDDKGIENCIPCKILSIKKSSGNNLFKKKKKLTRGSICEVKIQNFSEIKFKNLESTFDALIIVKIKELMYLRKVI